MKKLILLTTIILCSLGGANAQFAFKNQWNITGGGGWVSPGGFNILAGGEKALGSSYNSLHLKFNFMQNKADTDSPNLNSFKFQTYQILFNYNYSLAQLIPHPWYIQFGAGVNVGYENVPESPVNSVVIKNEGGVVYGLNAHLQIEFSAAKKVSFFLEPRFVYNFNSNLRKGFFITGLGIKYYL